MLEDGAALLAGLDLSPPDGVRLEEGVEEFGVAPRPLEVVEADVAGPEVGDNRVGPAGQPEEQALGLALEELGGAMDGLVDAQAATAGLDRLGVPDFGPDGDDVAQSRRSPG